MNIQSVLAEVGAWPTVDRLRLMEKIWDGLSEEGEGFEPSEELKGLLDRRIAALETHRDSVVPWEVVEARALERFRR